MKKPHAADEFEARIIAEAVLWTAFVQIAPFQRIRLEATNRPEIEAIGAALAAETGRSILIYAVNAAGRQALATTIPAASR